MNKKILTAIFMCIVFLLAGCVNEHDQLMKDGIKTKGFITDGLGKARYSGGTFDIKVEFKDEKGKWQSVIKSITATEFHSYSKGQQVMVIYSKKDPEIMEILTSNEAVAEYTGVKERDIEIADLNALVTMKKEHIDSFLNTITYSWTKTNDSAWINERKYQYVRLFPSKKSVIYISGPEEYRRFQKLVKDTDLQETAVEMNGEIGKKSFENDSLMIGLILSEEKKMLLSSVTLHKKDKH
jgi:hypothetical protein